MKLTIVHNFYQRKFPSGENQAVARDVEFLQAQGLRVQLFSRESESLEGQASLRAGAATLGMSRLIVRELMDSVHESQSDLVHVHNLYPLIGGAPLSRVRDRLGVPIVQTLHNRRLACIEGTETRDGAECHDCTRGSRVAGVVHRCYRSSLSASAALTIGMRKDKRILSSLNHYFAVSQDVRAAAIRAGVPSPLVTLKPNPIRARIVRELPQERAVLYAGRLEPEKGTHLLLDAWLSLPESQRPRLVLCGSGSLQWRVEAAAKLESDLRYLGNVPPEEVENQLERATMVAIPSVRNEGLPLLLAEAFAAGRPVLGPNFGEMSVAIRAGGGWAINTRRAADATRAIREAMLAPPGTVRSLGLRARSHFDRHYSESAIIPKQIATYERVVADFKRQGNSRREEDQCPPY